MAIVSEISWDDMFDGKPVPDNPARTAWRDAVAEIADKAKAKLPECSGRVESAVKIVLAGDVELQADGTARVASQSNGSTAYHVVNGHCDCMDFAKAPHNFCKHRLSAAIVRRAHELAKQRRAQLDGVHNGTSQPAPEQSQAQPTGDVPTSALPEAPASCNVYVTLAGRKVQVTLRDSDETRLLARLEALLQRFPADDDSGQESASDGRWERPGWCSTHGVQMTQHHNAKGSWWSHKLADGSWCHGK